MLPVKLPCFALPAYLCFALICYAYALLRHALCVCASRCTRMRGGEGRCCGKISHRGLRSICLHVPLASLPLYLPIRAIAVVFAYTFHCRCICPYVQLPLYLPIRAIAVVLAHTFHCRRTCLYMPLRRTCVYALLLLANLTFLPACQSHLLPSRPISVSCQPISISC